MIKRAIFFLVTLAAIIPIGIFVALNSHQVEYDYLIGKYTTFAWLPVVGGFVLGVLGMALFFTLSGKLWQIKARSLEKQLNSLHKEQQKKEIKAQFDDVKQPQNA